MHQALAPGTCLPTCLLAFAASVPPFIVARDQRILLAPRALEVQPSLVQPWFGTLASPLLSWWRPFEDSLFIPVDLGEGKQ